MGGGIHTIGGDGLILSTFSLVVKNDSVIEYYIELTLITKTLKL